MDEDLKTALDGLKADNERILVELGNVFKAVTNQMDVLCELRDEIEEHKTLNLGSIDSALKKLDSVGGMIKGLFGKKAALEVLKPRTDKPEITEAPEAIPIVIPPPHVPHGMPVPPKPPLPPSDPDE